MPAPAEEALLRDLEARAAALDRMPPPTTPEAANLASPERTERFSAPDRSSGDEPILGGPGLDRLVPRSAATSRGDEAVQWLAHARTA